MRSVADDLRDELQEEVNHLPFEERVALVMALDYLEALAKDGSREDFERVLARVPDVEPDPTSPCAPHLLGLQSLVAGGGTILRKRYP